MGVQPRGARVCAVRTRHRSSIWDGHVARGATATATLATATTTITAPIPHHHHLYHSQRGDDHHHHSHRRRTVASTVKQRHWYVKKSSNAATAPPQHECYKDHHHLQETTTRTFTSLRLSLPTASLASASASLVRASSSLHRVVATALLFVSLSHSRWVMLSSKLNRSTSRNACFTDLCSSATAVSCAGERESNRRCVVCECVSE